MSDLNISSNAFSINCFCSRWDTDNYSTILETWLNKSDCKTLRDNIVPGAVGELYSVLGKSYYYDMTWDSSNTITVEPKPGSKLSKMRTSKTIYPKNITTSVVKGPSTWNYVKIEGFLSGNQSL